MFFDPTFRARAKQGTVLKKHQKLSLKPEDRELLELLELLGLSLSP